MGLRFRLCAGNVAPLQINLRRLNDVALLNDPQRDPAERHATERRVGSIIASKMRRMTGCQQSRVSPRARPRQGRYRRGKGTTEPTESEIRYDCQRDQRQFIRKIEEETKTGDEGATDTKDRVSGACEEAAWVGEEPYEARPTVEGRPIFAITQRRCRNACHDYIGE